MRLENIRAYFTTKSLRHVTKSILFDELIWDLMKSAIYADAPEVGSVLKVSAKVSKNNFKRVLKVNVNEFSNQFFNHSLDRKESTLRVWDHRFAKRSFCGGLWSRGAAKVKRKFSIKILLINVCQTLSEKIV